MKSDKEIIDEIQGLLADAQSLLADIQIKEKNSEIPEWYKDRIELWCKVFNEANGAPIDKEKVDDIWVKMKKNKKGTAGFFTGKDASLQWTYNRKVVLTERAERKTKEYTGLSLKDYAKNFQKK